MVAQTVILTRTSTRSTPMPPGEDLASLGRTGATLAIQVSRRLLLDPVAVAYLQPGADRVPGAPLPPVFTLGRSDMGDAKVLLRFEVSLPLGAKVVEAYVLFLRAERIDCDPSPIALHADGLRTNRCAAAEP